jgi:hypothetical protein
MTWRLTQPRIAVVALALALPGFVWAQSDEPARPSYSRLMNIDALIDNHARFLARRYNLSADQESYTQAFLHAKADQFLSKHREELYNLIDRLVDVRAGAEMSQQELMTWGRQASPLYEEAKSLIVQGNNDWRQTLTEDQKKVHDEDLRDMYSSFTTTEDQLQRIVSGQMTLDEFRQGPGRSVPRLGPVPTPVPAVPPAQAKPAPANPLVREAPAPPPPATNSPPGASTGAPAPAKPSAPAAGAAPTAAGPAPEGKTSRAPKAETPAGKGDAPRPGRGGAPGRDKPAMSSVDPESQWEQYVREFVQRYQLDDEQTQRANSILKDCQDEARRIMEKRKPEIERLDKKLQSVAESKDAGGADKLKEMAEVSRQRTKLMEPIGEIFEKQLKPRLEKLPTRAQRQAAEASGGKPPVAGGKSGDKPGQSRSQPPAPRQSGAPGQPQPPIPVPQSQPAPAPPPPPPPPTPQGPPAQEPQKESAPSDE